MAWPAVKRALVRTGLLPSCYMWPNPFKIMEYEQLLRGIRITPNDVIRGQADVYSNFWPGPRIGCWPRCGAGGRIEQTDEVFRRRTVPALHVFYSGNGKPKTVLFHHAHPRGLGTLLAHLLGEFHPRARGKFLKIALLHGIDVEIDLQSVRGL